jgi:hypothetical protein
MLVFYRRFVFVLCFVFALVAVTQATSALSRTQAVTSAASALSSTLDPAPPVSQLLIDNGGPLLASPQVELIFWGTAWQTPDPAAPLQLHDPIGPSPATISSALATILASSYTSALHQYRGLTAAHLRASILLAPYAPPALFSTADVQVFLQSQIRLGALPAPASNPDLLYVVMLPPTVNSLPHEGLAAHDSFRYFDFSSSPLPSFHMLHFAWVTDDGTLANVTKNFSHELVEAMTDPEASGIIVSTNISSPQDHCPYPFTWCEVADVCDQVLWQIQGFTVAAYWSRQDKRCAGLSSPPHTRLPAPLPPLRLTASVLNFLPIPVKG